MDFELSSLDRDIKDAAYQFAEKEFPEIGPEYDEKEEFPRTLWKKAHELGLVGVNIPERFGGPGLGILHFCIISEEFWRIDPGLGQALISSTFGSDMLILFGNEEQQERYLSPLARGDAISAFAITEPDAGSDVSGCRTSAVKKGKNYIINGTKTFISNGSIADWIMVFCVTNPDNPANKRHSVFVLDSSTSGVETEEIKGKMGIRAADTAEISFQNVEIPAANLVGEEGEGFRQLMEFFNVTRPHVAAQGVGVAQGALDRTVAHVRKRVQFGKPLAQFQFVQFKVAELATKIEAARNLYLKAALAVDKGRPNALLSSMAKLAGGEIGVEATDWAVQLHGGYGYIKDYGVEKLYRDAKIVEIYEGAKEIEKLIIGKMLLKV
jgi:alkylation response protein AidB-like acyl-CoA dehydrogenase